MKYLESIRRHLKWFIQRRIKGFDERELWNLDITVAEFILPRFIEFRKNHLHIFDEEEDDLKQIIHREFNTEEERIEHERKCQEYTDYVLGEIQWFLEDCVKCSIEGQFDEYGKFNEEKAIAHDARYAKACELFGTHFRRLWT